MSAATQRGSAQTPSGRLAPADKKVIFASTLGTTLEWYDFYLYATLAPFFAALFFPPGNDTAALLSAFATYAAGFLVRPFGALLFGRVGDLVGRKFTFLATILLMGFATFAVGLLPTFEKIGWAAPILLVGLRLLQGLALGGEYGGAATYVAEHVPDRKRGYYTSYIQTTATLGFFLSMGIIGTARLGLGESDFRRFGWRLPFLLSFVLVAVSLWIRVRMRESPLFSRLKASGKASLNPLRESFANPTNRRYVLIALLGATAGQGVVWYTGQFYALTFLQAGLKLPWKNAYILVSIALALATPLFIFFGWLSDRVGRKRIMLAGCALAALTYVPIYMGLTALTNPHGLKVAAPGTGAQVGIVALLFVQMIYVCMVYGPIAAFLVELFPTRIRYTSMSIPYHLGNGWFGGFLPLIATALTTSAWAHEHLGKHARYAGLAYPIAVCLLTLLVGGLYIRETRDHKIDV